MIGPRPSKATGRPTRASSNRASGSCPDCSRRPDTTRLVEVPMTVTAPPRMVAYDSGMRKVDADRPL